MQYRSRCAWSLVVLLTFPAVLAAQTASRPASKPLPWNAYCHPRYRFCFRYPAGWTMLGEVFAGQGVVVAPPQKQDRELWDEVTVALAIRPPEGGADPVTIEEAIALASASVRKSGQGFETLQRQQRTVDDKPAELMKWHYVEEANGRDWIEELVFIEGPQAEIYSVALTCAPAALARLEPLFLRIVESWKLPDNPPAPSGADTGPAPGKPKSASPKAATPPKS